MGSRRVARRTSAASPDAADATTQLAPRRHLPGPTGSTRTAQPAKSRGNCWSVVDEAKEPSGAWSPLMTDHAVGDRLRGYVRGLLPRSLEDVAPGLRRSSTTRAVSAAIWLPA